ncbi:LysR family transcriptional regulator [Orbaceae bacterium ac157xtp]
MDIEIRLLRAFVTLAEAGSYRLSAEILFLTQPALTKQIQALERIIDRKLFLRDRNGAKLTRIGKKLYPEAQKLLKHHQNFLITAKNIKKATNDCLFIGFGISSFETVPKWVHTFSNEHPECEVVTKQVPSSTQIKMLMQGELDIGFVRMPVHHSLDSIHLYKEQIALAVPASIEVNPSNINNLLSMYPLLQIKPTLAPCLAEKTKLLLDSINFTTGQTSATNDLPSLLALIAGKNGIAFVPASVRHFLPKGVKLVIPELNQTGWDIAVAWNSKIPNTKRDLFLEMVKKEVFKKTVYN